jgi:coenzyme PQQ precursor peptide PqqA
MKKVLKQWNKPTLDDIPVTMEVAAYQCAEIRKDK